MYHSIFMENVNKNINLHTQVPCRYWTIFTYISINYKYIVIFFLMGGIEIIFIPSPLDPKNLGGGGVSKFILDSHTLH